MKNSKQALNHELVFKKVHRVIKFNKKSWLKSYMDMNTDLGKATKNDFEKEFFKLMNRSGSAKTMGNSRKNRNLKIATTEIRRNYLVSEPNHQTKKFLTENMSANETKKSLIPIKQPVYLGLPIIELSKTLIFEFWCDYVKPKYREKAKLCYTDTNCIDESR